METDTQIFFDSRAQAFQFIIQQKNGWNEWHIRDTREGEA